MQIAVRCECGKVLRVGEEHAGKQGKCPGCGRMVHIPFPPGVEEEPELVEPVPAASGPRVEDHRPVGSSLPWQDRGRHPSALAALWKTVQIVLLSPSEAFSRINVTGSLSGSLVFVLIVGSIGGYVAAAGQLLLHTLGWTEAAAGGVAEDLARLGVSVSVQVVLTLVLVPLGVLVGSFIASGIVHCCLWILGGANESFEATYAVVAYASGCTYLFNVIPICGGLIGAVWTIVIEIIGLRQAHRTTTGRAAIAVLLPVILCCGLVVVLAASMPLVAVVAGAVR